MSHSYDLSSTARLLDLMRRLRDPDAGCPWDREQTFQTIAPYTIEEAYEVADAIEREDWPDLRDELGDLLFQVVFHARMAEEAGMFGFLDVAESIHCKMVRRHPHIFGSEIERGVIASAEDQRAAWERYKAAERESQGFTSVLAGVPSGLPALTRALKLQERAAQVGFDWRNAREVMAKVMEEIEELRRECADRSEPNPDRAEDELGDLLFACTNLARHLKINPEAALRRANSKFERRFRFIEEQLASKDRTAQDASLDEMEALWQTAKAKERS
jgi:MazG family protein